MEQKFTLTPSTYNAQELVRRAEDILTIVRFYTEELMSLHEIADIYGISTTVAYEILRANGVKLRKRGRNR